MEAAVIIHKPAGGKGRYFSKSLSKKDIDRT